jgi:MFS family permease
MAPIGLAFAVLTITKSPGALGLVLAARSIPLIAFMIVGGAVADRMSRSRLLGLSNLGSGVTQGVVAIMLLTGSKSLGIIAALQVANGTFSAFTTPAMAGVVPQLVDVAGQQRANSLLSAAKAFTNIVGRPLAGVMVVVAGGGWVVALDAVSFLVAAIAAMRLGLVDPVTSAPVTSESGNLLTDIRDGWAAFRMTRWIWVGAASVMAANCLQAGIWTVLGPATATHTIGAAGWGLVVASGAIGLFVMSAAMYRLRPRYLLRFGFVCLPLAAVPLVTLSVSHNLVVLCAAAFIGGLGMDGLNVAWTTSLQSHVPPAMLSRVTAFDNVGAFVAIPIGQVAVAPAAAVLGANRVECLGGLLFAMTAVLPLLLPEVRSLRQPGQDIDESLDTDETIETNGGELCFS